MSKRYDTSAGQQELRERGVRPVPIPDALTRPFWESTRAHQLVLQRCGGCERYQHPPAPACAQCGGAELHWEPISGRGSVYSFIIDRRLMIPSFDEPYAVAQIIPEETTDDRVRITAKIVDCGLEAVRIGMPVEVVFEDVSDSVTLAQFRPRSAESETGGLEVSR